MECDAGRRTVGYFGRAEDAALAADREAFRRDGPAARLNFPDVKWVRLRDDSVERAAA